MSVECRAGMLSSKKIMMESLWEEFFRDPSLFYDMRSLKISPKSPDFRHKCNGKALWINGFYNPRWVNVKLQDIELPRLDENSDHGAIIQHIRSCGIKKDISGITKVVASKGWIINDISIANTIIRSYAKCSALKEAQETFDQLAERTVVSWTALIAGYVEHGFCEEALRCFREMESDGVAPNSVTYTCCLKACAIMGTLEIIEEMHARVKEKGLLDKHIILGNSLVNAYSKCGAVKEAQEVFDQLDGRDVVSWSALIAGYVEKGLVQEALMHFGKMKRDSVIPNSVTYACSLKACATVGDIGTVKEIHAQVREQGLLNGDLVLGNSLVNAYVKCGSVKEARQVFDMLTKRDVVSWSALIAGYVEHGSSEEALSLFRNMESDGLVPDSVTYVCALKACATVGAVDTVDEIHAQVRDHGLLNRDTVLGNSLINAYAKCGNVKKAQQVFDKLVERNVVSWSTLIAGYVEQGFGQEALRCFREMERDSVKPNSVTYACSLKGCAIVGDLETVKEIHAEVREQGLLKKNIVLGNSLVNAYAKCGAVKEAQDIFDQLLERDAMSWSALINGYAELGFGEEALTCFKEMENDAVNPIAVTYACTLKACAIVGALEIVEEINAQVREQGLLHKHFVLGNILVNAYARCGAVKEAQRVFDQLMERNVESWTSLLAGYAELGQVNEMLQLFTKMVADGVLPDPVTFLVLLNGCSHGALLEEGETLFHVIETYGVDTTQDHYTSMVDLFGRAGQLDKAKWFVLDYTPTLLAFLGACQKWLNVDFGRWAFKKLLPLNQNCASAYVCMANIYAAAGMMKEANEIEILRAEEHFECIPVTEI